MLLLDHYSCKKRIGQFLFINSASFLANGG